MGNGRVSAVILAADYLARGWVPVPIPAYRKGPRFYGWQNYAPSRDDIRRDFSPDMNVGVLLGEPSGWLVDIDLDCEEAVAVAAVLFRSISSRFGRDGNPASHYLMVCEGAETIKYMSDRKPLLELRSTGCQTVMPGSVHPSGESVRWEIEEDPVIMERAELEAICGTIAASVLIMRRDGVRASAALEVVEGLPGTESQIPSAARAWLGLATAPVLPLRRELPRRGNGGDLGNDQISDAVERYITDHPMDYPTSGRECPVCGSDGAWKALPGSDGRKWFCWSTRHDAHKVGGQASRGGWVGDVLDLDAYRARMGRVAVLRDRGYLSDPKRDADHFGELPDEVPDFPDQLPEELGGDYGGDPSGDPLDVLTDEVSRADGKVGRARVVADFMRDGDRWQGLVSAAKADPVRVDAGLMTLGAVEGMTALAKRLERRLRESLTDSRAKKKRADLVVLGPDDDLADPSEQLTTAGLRVPEGWALCDDGIFQERPDSEGGVAHVRVTRAPVMVTGVLVDVDTDDVTAAPVEHVCLEWRLGDGRWTHGVVPRSRVRDTRALVKLSDVGIDSGSHNARALVGWLAACEGENAEDLPRAWVAKRMGWMGDNGRLGFMVGAQHIGPDAQGEDRRLRPRDWHACHVQLDAVDGYAQMASGFRTSGDLDGWRRAVESVGAFPSPILALYASLAAPMVAILDGAPNAILDWSGDTSRGKTSLLRIAASVWGVPSKRGGGLISSWDTTQVGVERATGFFHDLPLILDDTKDCKNKEIISSVLYSFSGGAGRMRGSIDGVRRSSSARGVLLSTGEQAITEYSQDAGARARVLQLGGSPFGSGDQRAVVEGLAVGLADHHGPAGPEMIRWLLRNRDEWDGLKRAYESKRSRWAEKASGADGSSVGARIAGTLALLEMGAHVAHSVLGVAAPGCDPMGYALESAAGVVRETDRPRAALESVYAWACAHEVDFWGRHQTIGPAMEPKVPSRGWAGSWDKLGEDYDNWAYVAFIPDALRRILKHQGYEDVSGIMASWRERGWIQTTGNRRGYTMRTRVGSSRVGCVRLARAGFVEAGVVER